MQQKKVIKITIGSILALGGLSLALYEFISGNKDKDKPSQEHQDAWRLWLGGIVGVFGLIVILTQLPYNTCRRRNPESQPLITREVALTSIVTPSSGNPMKIGHHQTNDLVH